MPPFPLSSFGTPLGSFLSLNIWLWVTGLSILFCVLWVLHLRIRNAFLADVGFCLAFALVVLACGISGTGELSRRIVISGMGFVYAVRLGWYLFTCRVWNKPEDSRYQTIRTMLGRWESVGLFAYFQLQVPACLFLRHYYVGS